MTILVQESIIMENVEKFYNDKKNFEIISDIINKRSNISRRLLDWFVTTYSKNNNIVINKKFNVYQQYKNKLKGLNKRKFDPFCRSYTKAKECPRFIFKNTHGELITTVGQLNFFQWAIENNIIQYIDDNYSILIDLINFKSDTLINTSKRQLDNGTVEMSVHFK